jgi:hypothetical protein
MHFFSMHTRLYCSSQCVFQSLDITGFTASYLCRSPRRRHSPRRTSARCQALQGVTFRWGALTSRQSVLQVLAAIFRDVTLSLGLTVLVILPIRIRWPTSVPPPLISCIASEGVLLCFIVRVLAIQWLPHACLMATQCSSAQGGRGYGPITRSGGLTRLIVRAWCLVYPT